MGDPWGMARRWAIISSCTFSNFHFVYILTLKPCLDTCHLLTHSFPRMQDQGSPQKQWTCKAANPQTQRMALPSLLPLRMLPEPSQASSTHQHANDECHEWGTTCPSHNTCHFPILPMLPPLPTLALASVTQSPPTHSHACPTQGRMSHCGVKHTNAAPLANLRTWAVSEPMHLFHHQQLDDFHHYQLSQPRNTAQQCHLTLTMLLRGFLVGLSVIPMHGLVYPQVSWNPYPDPSEPVPTPRVWVFMGSPGIPQGYPWQSLWGSHCLEKTGMH